MYNLIFLLQILNSRRQINVCHRIKIFCSTAIGICEKKKLNKLKFFQKFYINKVNFEHLLEPPIFTVLDIDICD